MKKIIILSLLFIGSLQSCEIQQRPDARPFGNDNIPVSTNNNQLKLEVVGKYDISAGWLYVYKLGNDTLYIVEGTSSSSPVSLTIKK